MDEQTRILYHFPQEVYAEGSPVVIESAMLQANVETDKVFSVFQIRNIAGKTVRSCKIRVWANDEAGNMLQCIEEYVYSDVNAVKGEVFGFNTPIYFDSVNVRTMSVIVLDVLFDDGTSWDGSNAKWDWLRETPRKEENVTQAWEQGAPMPEQIPPVQPEAGSQFGAKQPPKKKKKGLVGIILALLALGAVAVGVLIVIGVFVIWPFAKKEIAYNKANDLMVAAAYDEAYEAYTELGDYKNSAEMAKEAMYGKADDYFAKGMFPDSIEVWTSILEYKDSADRIVEAKNAILERKYQGAVEAANGGNYLTAIEMFADIMDYKDSADRYNDAIYMYALQLSENEEHVSAIEFFSECANYKDSAEKIKENKYAYVKKHQDSTDEITYQYISDLVDSGYSGAKELYNEIYQWKIKITAVNTDPDDDTTRLTSCSRYEFIYFHYTVSGGAPGASEDIQFVGNLPNCAPIQLDGTIYSGQDPSYYYIYYTYGSATGTASAYFYDSKGNLLASDSIVLY